MSSPILELDTVHKSYSSFVAVDQLSLQVPRATIYGLLGPNGAGKTSTIRMIMNIIVPDSGRILFDGSPWTEKLLDRIGYLPEERGLYRKMKVVDLLLFLAEIKSVNSRQGLPQILSWLERMGLSEWKDKKLDELSKGMQQKIQFIGCVVHNPDLLILDEPFAGLDPINVAQLKEILLDLKQQGKTILLSTHRMDQAEVLCDSICLINKSRKILDGSWYVPAGVLRQETPEYYSASTTNVVQNSILENALSKTIVEIRLGLEGVPSEKIQSALKPVSTKLMKVTKEGTMQENKQSFMAGFIFIFMLYIVILIYGVSVMRSVIEEKSSRIVEVILSSLRPMQLLAGKIIGVGAVGLTQVGIWVAASGLLTLYGASAYRMAAADSKWQFNIPFSMLGYFVLYFTLGFILFSTLYATVGSMVNSEQEAQHYQMPVLIGLILPMILLSFILKNPNSPVSIALSLFPLFCPILTFMRIVIQTPPVWQIALSLLSMLLGIWVCTWIAAKIYRVGILMYGKPPSLPEILRWIRYS